MTPEQLSAPLPAFVPPNFDPVARIYRIAEYLTLGPLLQRTRTHFLPQLPPCHRALLLGDGDGRFLAQLLSHQPNLRALAIDTSATMLQLLRRRCQPHAHRLQTLQASALTVAPPPDIDLITTHFFLDCLTQPELDALAHQVADHTSPGTLWLLSDFAIPATPLLRPLAAVYIRSLYLAFRVLTGLRVTRLPNPQSALSSAGFDRIARHDLLCGLLYTELWQHR
jgi:SAM-dependent methyltransferase